MPYQFYIWYGLPWKNCPCSLMSSFFKSFPVKIQFQSTSLLWLTVTTSAPNDRQKEKNEDLIQALGKRVAVQTQNGRANCSIGTGCVRVRYYLYKHANLPKTSKSQVLAIVWSRKSGSWPLFSLIPHSFSELLMSLTVRHLCAWHIFLQGTYIFPQGTGHVYLLMACSYLSVNRGQQRASLCSLTSRFQTGAVSIPSHLERQMHGGLFFSYEPA